jgi:hypothetical protein
MDNQIDIQMMYSIITAIDTSYYLKLVYKNDLDNLKLI